MEKERIRHALEALDREINNSTFKDQQKIALKAAVDKLKNYYEKKIQEIEKARNFYVARNKEYKLYSIMVDSIVEIDDALKGFADPNMVSSEVNRVVNRVEKKKLFKKG